MNLEGKDGEEEDNAGSDSSSYDDRLSFIHHADLINIIDDKIEDTDIL